MGLLSGRCLKSCDFVKIIARNANSLARSKGPTITDVEKSTNDVKIDKKIIAKLEKISLVDFDNETGVRRLEAAVSFAKKLRDVPLDKSVKPMYSVLEDERLELRDDKVTEGYCRDVILKNAKVLEDEYFIAPLGNIPNNPKDS